MVEQKKASVVKKGKLQTIIQNIVKLVREDFTWKDPAAAEKAGMQQMDYVIGGMDQTSSCDCIMPSAQWTTPGWGQA